MPISRRVRATRIAISPRLAIRTFWNIGAESYLSMTRWVVCPGAPHRVAVAFHPFGRSAGPEGRRRGSRQGRRHHARALRPRLGRRGSGGRRGRAGARGRDRPAVEMSCVHEYAEDLHICGYWVDLAEDRAACERAQGERRARAGEIVENLRGFGFELTLDDAIREAGGADSIGRPHIAKAAGATGDLGPFFEEYLVPGAKAFVPRRWPDAAQAICLIHEAGGVAVIAHPYWDISEPGEVDDLIRSLGADGVETFYPPTPRSRPSTCSSSAPSSTSSRPPPPTTTARPTRPSPSSGRTRPTASASPRSRRSRLEQVQAQRLGRLLQRSAFVFRAAVSNRSASWKSRPGQSPPSGGPSLGDRDAGWGGSTASPDGALIAAGSVPGRPRTASRCAQPKVAEPGQDAHSPELRGGICSVR